MAQNMDPTAVAGAASVTRRFALVAIVAPAVLTLAAVALQLAWLPDTPDPIATHWSWVNGPDGSGPGWTYPLLTVLLGLGLPAWLWATALPRLRKGARGWTFRFLAAMALGLSAFGAVSMTWSVGMQRGLDSWQDAPSVTPALLVGAAAGAAFGLIGYFVQPKQVTVFEALPAAHVDVASGERVVWLGLARAGRAVVAVMITSVVLLAAGALAAWIGGSGAVAWFLVGAGVLVAVLGLTTLEADVRVDATGVEVKGPAGWPRSRVAIADVASASAITVEALGSFGGWGWRRRPGVTGVIMRSGEALKVERKDGHSLVVTVDDAATAAALVTAFAARAGGLTMLLRINPEAEEPLFAQVAAGIRAQILSGETRPGERLPPARDVASGLGVNLHTVLHAYQQLRDEGLVDLRRGRGAVVTEAADAVARLESDVAELGRRAARLGMAPDAVVALIREAM